MRTVEGSVLDDEIDLDPSRPHYLYARARRAIESDAPEQTWSSPVYLHSR